MKKQILTTLFLLSQATYLNATPENKAEEDKKKQEEMTTDIKTLKDQNRTLQEQVKHLEGDLVRLTNAIYKSTGPQGDIVKNVDNLEGGTQILYVKLVTEFKDIRIQLDLLKQQSEMLRQQLELLNQLRGKK